MPELPTQGDDQSGDPLKIDFSIVARDLKLPPEKIAKTVELLDAGNTIPFVTRFRKDLTGGLNEQQVLAIKQRVGQLRALAERKTFVLKSIDSQGNLSEDLALQINKATTSRRLEDLYLPFKPQKQSRAALARQQGLEPLANDILQANSPDVEIATRATEFVRVDKGLNSVDDVIKGVGDILAEKFSGNDELRSKLR
ncbi:RNA-binding transcriptional accessory protein, partial [Mariniblastus sp.]|nr:RNA-binding transcriptional accessory protein [Mariniblastus sp.]